jgi:glutamate dehydrogenase (NADP+)
MSPNNNDPERRHKAFMAGLIRRNPDQPEFHQAVAEVARNIIPFIFEHPEYRQAQILERMTEPDRIIIFRVCWQDDHNNIRVNRGTRVQFNNAIGPYKGGLRFHPSVNLSILKVLGFEQTFKNSLTTLPMGGAKGGANFNPKGKSDGEVMRFCHSLHDRTLQVHRPVHRHPRRRHRRRRPRRSATCSASTSGITDQFTGALTGKGLAFGGSLIRTEATGYGCVYFAKEMLATRGDGLKNKTCVISGSGNVAQYTAEKLLQEGAKVVTMSDSGGFIHDENGIDEEKLAWIIDLKKQKRGRIQEYEERWGGSYYEGQKALGRALRSGLSQRHSERNRRIGRPDADRQRRETRRRGRQHAERPSRPSTAVPQGENPVCPQQGGQRRRRRRLGARADAERAAADLDPRRGRQSASARS